MNMKSQCVTCSEMKAIERMADAGGLSYYQMMENAGSAAAEYIMQIQEKCKVEIFCGKGNNGGDGFVVARKLSLAGYDVTVVLVEGPPKTIDAAVNFELLQKFPVTVIDINVTGARMKLLGENPQLMVDCIYGTGFRGPLRENGLQMAMYMNKNKILGTKIVSLDVPSGLEGDMRDIGEADPDAVRADVTIAFHAVKPVHCADNSEIFCGHMVVADIGIDIPGMVAEEPEEEAEEHELLAFEEPKAAATKDPEVPEANVGISKLNKLEEILNGYGSMIVALSGGVDSVFLLTFAHRLWRDDRVAALIAEGPFFPREETEYAQRICDRLGISSKRINAEYVVDEVKQNPEDRCYYCKKEIMSSLRDMAFMTGSVPADGTNLDDMDDYRPGCRALEELHIASPLKEAGFTKNEIRNALRMIAEEDEAVAEALELVEFGGAVKIWDKPAAACLASRIPYGEEITRKKLNMIYESEKWLKDKGFTQVRVRCHELTSKAGEEPKLMARIELTPDAFAEFLSVKDEAERLMLKSGFSLVTLDIGGYERGKLNSSDRLPVEEEVVRGETDTERMAAIHREIDEFIRKADERDYSFEDFTEIIKRLRQPDGCPWDREQTHESLKKHMIEEVNETLDAIDEGDSHHLCEELGDVLLQVVLHAEIASEDGEFTIDDVIRKASSKMVRRHPHVFGNIKVDGLEDQLDLWEEIKKREKMMQ